MNRSIADAQPVDSKMIEAQPARPVLLVGSVPLGSVAEVFEVVAANLGDLIRRVPDGEVGPRLEWIAWQKQTMGRATGIEIGGFREIQGGAVKYTQYKIKVGLRPEDVDFGSLGYAEAAKTSYAKFKEVRDAGKIPRGVRFQVSLPTPLAVVFAFFIPSDIRKVWPVYEQRLFDEVDEIVATIPQEDLAIQWDVAVEIDGILEVPAVAKSWSKDELIDAIIRACNRVPAAVELGIHLCYGDPGHKHLVEPTDMGLMVELANRFTAKVKRPITWVHMPVPRDRDDEAYFAPLQDLRLHSGTELYIGLIHLRDGISGAIKRLAAAKQVIPKFGIATECGFGRRNPETIFSLIKLHREVAFDLEGNIERIEQRLHAGVSAPQGNSEPRQEGNA